MKWRNVKLIWQREVRDQMRDRRTLFTIAVLPLLLYPLMGMVVLQVLQFRREYPPRVAVVGADRLPDQPALIVQDGPARFDATFASADSARLELELLPSGPEDTPADDIERARVAVSSGAFDAVVCFPANFHERLEQFDQVLSSRPDASPEELTQDAPQPQVFYNAANDKSKIAHDRVTKVLEQWKQEIVRRNLAARHVPVRATEPFDVVGADVAPHAELRAALWSKLLPFVAMIWALTGAFYPAIDICAGEKERGTLETLLSSPAQRSEIVCGKLFTVMAFSMATAVLNLASMGATGLFVLPHLKQMAPAGSALAMGPPPLSAAVWLLLALGPISALFSAVSMAVAALARSSKEGQYYLMPILLISLPLMILPVLPTAELDLGTSLIPVSGVMMLLRVLIEGRYAEAAQYAAPVLGTTALCCLLAIRWAIGQFNNESVLFRESERWGIGLWLRHLVRDREDTPTFGEAMLCGVLLLVMRFLANFVATMPKTWEQLASMTFVTQVALIATPAVLMAIMLTRRPRKALLLTPPQPLAIPLAMLLAVLLHPAAMAVNEGIHVLYPLSEAVQQQFDGLNTLVKETDLLYVLALMALLPAVCEELAFRGFILSGLRHMGHKWSAILISSAFFGLMHVILQQSLAACVVGIVLGYLAVQSGSLLPGVLFHVTYNSLTLMMGRLSPDDVERSPVLRMVLQPVESGIGVYHWGWGLAATAAAVGVLAWFRHLPYQRTVEEKLQDAIDHQAVPAAVR